MLRTAERLVLPEQEAITVLLVGDSEDKVEWMEGQVRLLLGANEAVVLRRAVVAEGGEAALAEVLRQLKGGLVIAQFGGWLVPLGGEIRYLISSLECPLLLMR